MNILVSRQAKIVSGLAFVVALVSLIFFVANRLGYDVTFLPYNLRLTIIDRHPTFDLEKNPYFNKDIIISNIPQLKEKHITEVNIVFTDQPQSMQYGTQLEDGSIVSLYGHASELKDRTLNISAYLNPEIFNLTKTNQEEIANMLTIELYAALLDKFDNEINSGNLNQQAYETEALMNRSTATDYTNGHPEPIFFLNAN